MRVSGVQFEGNPDGADDLDGVSVTNGGTLIAESINVQGFSGNCIISGENGQIDLRDAGIQGCSTGIAARYGGTINAVDTAIQNTEIGIGVNQGSVLRFTRGTIQNVVGGVWSGMEATVRLEETVIDTTTWLGLAAYHGGTISGTEVEILNSTGPGAIVGKNSFLSLGHCHIHDNDGAGIVLEDASSFVEYPNCVLEGNAGGNVGGLLQ